MDQLKIVIKFLLKKVGLRLQRYATASNDWGDFFELVKGLGFEPANVIDVGVGWGTEPLYASFPNAHYILVEPVRSFSGALSKLVRRFDAIIINKAAGAKRDKITMHVENTPTASSADAIHARHIIDSYEVDVVRLDEVVKLRAGATLLKIDVQGAELDVMEGCSGLLERLDIVILETSLINPHVGKPELAEIVAYMRSRGFVVYGIIGGVKRPLDRALTLVDLVFVPENHWLRRDRRWDVMENL